MAEDFRLDAAEPPPRLERPRPPNDALTLQENPRFGDLCGKAKWRICKQWRAPPDAQRHYVTVDLSPTTFVCF
jgi:hypothetical protein